MDVVAPKLCPARVTPAWARTLGAMSRSSTAGPSGPPGTLSESERAAAPSLTIVMRIVPSWERVAQVRTAPSRRAVHALQARVGGCGPGEHHQPVVLRRHRRLPAPADLARREQLVSGARERVDVDPGTPTRASPNSVSSAHSAEANVLLTADRRRTRPC